MRSCRVATSRTVRRETAANPTPGIQNEAIRPLLSMDAGPGRGLDCCLSHGQLPTYRTALRSSSRNLRHGGFAITDGEERLTMKRVARLLVPELAIPLLVTALASLAATKVRADPPIVASPAAAETPTPPLTSPTMVGPLQMAS